jgi:hypothetical protein
MKCKKKNSMGEKKRGEKGDRRRKKVTKKEKRNGKGGKGRMSGAKAGA